MKRIGEIAHLLGLNPRTIRYYESLGLLPRPARSRVGYRMYGDVERDRLTFIRKARAVGLTLADIREILTLRDGGTPPCGHVAALLNQKLASVDAQISALGALRQALVRLSASASRAPNTGSCICGIIEQEVVFSAPRPVRKRQPHHGSLAPQS